MRRIKLSGLCLIGAFVLGASVAASARAAQSESGPLRVVSEGIGASLLESPAANISCKGHNVGGYLSAFYEITTATTAKEVFARYRGCEDVGLGTPCENVGPGEIETKKLISDLDWVSKAKGEVGVELKPEAGEVISEFECKGLGVVKLYGSVIGLITPTNAMTTEGKVNFASEENKNRPERFEGEPTETLEAEVSRAKRVEAGETRADRIKTTTGFRCKCKRGMECKCPRPPAEINTVASGTPEYGRCKKKHGGRFSDANCTTRAHKKGKYEFVPIPG
jgi:hypothetical protein